MVLQVCLDHNAPCRSQHEYRKNGQSGNDKEIKKGTKHVKIESKKHKVFDRAEES